MSRWLGVLVFIIWLGPILVLFFWDAYPAQMFNHRIMRKDVRSCGSRHFTATQSRSRSVNLGHGFRGAVTLVSWGHQFSIQSNCQTAVS